MQPEGRRLGRRDAGLSLVEIMLAFTILCVVMVMLFGSLLSTQTLSRVNKDKHRALMDSTALMEQMAMMPIADLGATFPHATEIPEFNGLHVPDQRVQVIYDNADPNARPLLYRAGRMPARLSLRGVRAR
jgi:type II secretory pathway component PulJ